ncbi:hypothetical protein GGTG_07988 [Gaeumannomyces tritici R3-111a-1]|uniref:Uncharacterized protein n=1 Tax=Gaeumannomyces tritici (strain R3-111a-1) TaxID=644352 RepID=J3P3A0_GAET3|nr:hypothetical protein GGTG_07988 [Gaeumannomyces tritici R3-111a-1]EJT74142.1 hypothetical protein GGTG_07988 [Gaeumannomyces tritici R3-111a-1]
MTFQAVYILHWTAGSSVVLQHHPGEGVVLAAVGFRSRDRQQRLERVNKGACCWVPRPEYLTEGNGDIKEKDARDGEKEKGGRTGGWSSAEPNRHDAPDPVSESGLSRRVLTELADRARTGPGQGQDRAGQGKGTAATRGLRGKLCCSFFFLPSIPPSSPSRRRFTKTRMCRTGRSIWAWSPALEILDLPCLPTLAWPLGGQRAGLGPFEEGRPCLAMAPQVRGARSD